MRQHGIRALAGHQFQPRTTDSRHDLPIAPNLKGELVRQRRWASRDEARRDLFAYIEGDINRQRIHSALGYITPEQAERNAS